MTKKFFRLLYPRISSYKTTAFIGLSTCVSDKFSAEANSTLSGVDKYLWASNRLSSPHSWWSEKTVLAFRRRHCLPDSEENKEENGMPKKKGKRPFKMVTKGRSILFNYFIDMRTTLSLSISCKKTVFVGKFQQKHVFSTWNGQMVVFMSKIIE